MNQIYCGDIRDIVKTLPDQSVNCIVTSPPYFGLRDYGVDKQIGLEATPEAYVDTLVGIFRELKLVLRDDGSVWLNLGDSYAGNNSSNGEGESRNLKTELFHGGSAHLEQRRVISNCDLKPKNLIGIPWRVAFALQADGWILRSDIIWHKKNPMPESVTDRPTKSHEYIFLLSKKPRYYYDNEAVREAIADSSIDRAKYSLSNNHSGYFRDAGTGSTFEKTRNGATMGEAGFINLSGRNRRTVWTVSTKPYKAAHFAVFPPDLIRPCILAGCPQQVCGECGEPWARVVEKSPSDWDNRKSNGATGGTITQGHNTTHGTNTNHTLGQRSIKTIGIKPACNCNADTIPGVVLDPFMGSGTVAQVAIETGRNWLGVELNPEYIELANKRIVQTQPPLPIEAVL